ncbi:glycosyltransferase family 4 protein [Cellulomonas endometrii]|uniref:glycosyltransferase family 4 protein n=1 Tax=Cellulomonas endometrii TaxID=3036301 RepID=UPI0024AD6885|nr:glycosyltransferase family 1 protein [Cellulomonas endometrii]
MTLRVLVDATAVPADRGGVGRYVDELLTALATQQVQVGAACLPRDAERVAATGARPFVVPAQVARRPVRLVWEQTELPRLAARTRAHVLHSPHYTRPLLAPAASVVTLHDATFFSHPELHDPVKARFFRTATRAAVRTADALVTPSAATRDEVLAHAGGDPERFHVAYHGVDRGTFRATTAQERAAVARELGLEGRRYVAFLGTLEPRKNVPALVRAWIRTAGDMPEHPALVLAGARGWDHEIERVRAEVPAHLRLVVPGYLPIEQLAPLLGGAEVVAYPSLGEGFGLPVLEAMACGACVLTTRELSLPEVGGEAVAYCGTGSEEIEAGLRALLAHPRRRATLGAAAAERAAEFTWRRSAEQHLAAYEAAARRRPRR